MDHVYDFIIIGAGMIGSSTAKYVAKICSQKTEQMKIAIVGYNEKECKDHDLQGAWHDEARITRLLDNSFCWRKLAEESLLRYKDIENESNICFYEEVGYLSLIDEKYENFEKLQEAVEVLQKSGYSCEKVDSQALRTRIPYLNVATNIYGFFQPDFSGFINPRKLIEAQSKIAGDLGCKIIRDGVLTLSQNAETHLYQIQTMSGEFLFAKNVILATGAYMNLSGHLPSFTEKQLDLRLTSATIAFIEISSEEAERLKTMPAIVTSYSSGNLDGTYILPPVLYPNGKYYLKLGHGDKFKRIFHEKEEVENWYKNGTGDQEAVHDLSKFIQTFIKDLKVESVSSGCCVTTKTKDKAGPYIDKVQDGLYVAGGGCGFAAKSCDEIGRIAAMFAVTGTWDTEIDQQLMTIKWRDD